MSLIEKNEVLALIDEIINRDHLTAMARLFLLRCEVYELPPAESDLTESIKAEICNDICRYPYQFSEDEQEDLDAICEKCPIGGERK